MATLKMYLLIALVMSVCTFVAEAALKRSHTQLSQSKTDTRGGDIKKTRDLKQQLKADATQPSVPDVITSNELETNGLANSTEVDSDIFAEEVFPVNDSLSSQLISTVSAEGSSKDIHSNQSQKITKHDFDNTAHKPQNEIKETVTNSSSNSNYVSKDVSQKEKDSGEGTLNTGSEAEGKYNTNDSLPVTKYDNKPYLWLNAPNSAGTKITQTPIRTVSTFKETVHDSQAGERVENINTTSHPRISVLSPFPKKTDNSRKKTKSPLIKKDIPVFIRNGDQNNASAPPPRTSSLSHMLLQTVNSDRPTTIKTIVSKDSAIDKVPGKKPRRQNKPAVKTYGRDIDNSERNVTEDNTPSPCPTCGKNGLTEDDVRRIHLDMFKTLIAKKLRIQRTDNGTQDYQSDGKMAAHTPKLPNFILEQTMKDNAEELDKDQFYARDQEIIIGGTEEGQDCIEGEVSGCFSFSIRDKIKWQVAETYLWFYKTPDDNDAYGQTFNVSSLEWDKSKNMTQVSIIASEVTHTKEGWISVNVTNALLGWIDTRTHNPVLSIQCSTCQTENYQELLGTKNDTLPLLDIKYSQNSQMTRKKRSVLCDPQVECCKRELVVSFHEISMNEVFEPRNLSIGYCYGGCNGIHEYTYNHTQIVQQLRYSHTYANHPNMNKQLRPCCVPLILKDTFLMTVENNEYIRKIVPKVIVETCGCM